MKKNKNSKVENVLKIRVMSGTLFTKDGGKSNSTLADNQIIVL